MALLKANTGIGTTNPTAALHVFGNSIFTGIITATTFVGSLTGTATTASSVTLDSVGLGTHTYGDYVKDITGTSNQVIVTSGTGEGSSPVISLPNALTAPQDLTVTRDLQVNRNLNVTGNITIGGSSATLFTTELKIYDPDIVLGFRTDAFGNDSSTDSTANHGGIAIASTEGNPLTQLFIAGIETNPATYKKFMWFKEGTFAGLGTDAWLSNYAIGIGSTQFPSGTRFATGSIQFGENDIRVVRSINASGIITATGGFNLGISSGGTSITSGPVKTLNFIGAGNTFAINGTTVDISISGGGGAVSIGTAAPSSPTAGSLWYNSNLGRIFVYYNDGSSSQWVDAAPFNLPEPSSTPGKTSSTFTATSGQTTFVVSFRVGYIDVFLNGVRLNSSEYSENDGSQITLIEPAAEGDVIDVIQYTMGIGNTGATGAAGPLSGVTSITTDSTHYPIFVTGIGSVNPYVSVASSYFSFNPASGTLVVNQMGVVGVSTARDFNSSSDVNLKKNIQIIQNPVDKLQSINGVSFDWKEVEQSSMGVIAQDVEKVLPELVSESNGKKSVNYNGLIGVLIEAVKEQQEQINMLRKEIEELKK